MGWANVNGQPPWKASDMLQAEVIPRRGPKEAKGLPSGYRANILAAAERLSNDRSKRAKRLKRDDPPSCNIGKKIQNQNKPTSQEHEQPQNKVERRLSLPGSIPRFKNADRNLKPQNEQSASSMSQPNPTKLQQAQGSPELLPSRTLEDFIGTSNLVNASIFDSEQNKPGMKRMPHGGQSINTVVKHTFDHKSVEHDYTHRAANLKEKVVSNAADIIIVESSKDEYDSFEDFDDSVFDYIAMPPSSQISCSPTKSQKSILQYTIRNSNSPSAPYKLQPAKHKVIYSNGAPFAPFMHSCLKDDFISVVNRGVSLDPNSSSLMLTCFRVAEALRLISAFKLGEWPPSRDMKIALFGTVHEVKYADNLGSGQGMVFSDLFFANKPPYISATCKMPYNAKDLTGDNQGIQSMRRPIKAIIKVVEARELKPSESRLLSGSERFSRDSINLEVLDVHLSS